MEEVSQEITQPLPSSEFFCYGGYITASCLVQMERKWSLRAMFFLLQLRICNMLLRWMSFILCSLHLAQSRKLQSLRRMVECKHWLNTLVSGSIFHGLANPDETTAAVANEALEGHCIYDGGYCKLHLSYSSYDLNVKAHSDEQGLYNSRGHSPTSTITPWCSSSVHPLFMSIECYI